MKIYYSTLLLLFFHMSCTAPQSNFEEIESIGIILKDYNATMVIQTPDKKIIGYNKTRADMRFIPGSVFKIANSVIALSEKIVTNTEDIFYHYNGQQVFLDIWTNNMNLAAAFKTSNVPAFQEIAKKIGIKKYRSYLNKFHYGNTKTGAVVDRFWLDGPLTISATEHVIFLDHLLGNQFDLDSNAITQLKEIAFLSTLDNGWKLYGKTGWPEKIGWFAGWLEKDNQRYIFTMNIDIDDFNQLYLREEFTKKILTQLVR